MCLGPSEGCSSAFPTLRADMVAMPLGPQVESRVSGSVGGVGHVAGACLPGEGLCCRPRGPSPSPKAERQGPELGNMVFIFH